MDTCFCVLRNSKFYFVHFRIKQCKNDMIIKSILTLKQTFGRRGPAKFLIFFLIIPNIYIINIVFKKINFFVRFNDTSQIY